MRDIFEESISWKEFNSGHDAFSCEIENAELDQESGTLHVDIGLDFVVPKKDDIRIKKALHDAIEGVDSITINYDYDVAGMRSDPDDTARLYAGREIGKLSPVIRNSIDPDKIEINNGVITVKLIGGKSIKEINDIYPVKISGAIKEKFGLDYKIRFERDEEGRKALQERMERSEEELARIAVEDAAKAARAPKAGGEGKKKEGSSSFSDGRVLGKKINGEPIAISELKPDLGDAILAGTLFHVESRLIKKGRVLAQMLITDKKNSACVKVFAEEDKWEKASEVLTEGTYVICRGKTEFNLYENETALIARDINTGVMPTREDRHEGRKRVELHCHTKMSAMDGLNEPSGIVSTSAGWGQPAVAITDHGVVQSFPDAAATQAKLAKKGKNIKLIYGMEGYLLPDEGLIGEDGVIDYKARPTNHIIILAATQEGLKNLYKLVSISHLEYFYKKPRIPRSVLEKYRKGLILGSACEAGEVYRAVEEGKSDEELEKIASYYDYLEIQPLINNKFLIENGTVTSEDDLKAMNRRVVDMADRLGKPVVATTDAHYDEPESAVYRNILLAGMGFKDAENGKGLFLRTTDEMLDEFSYLGKETAERIVIDNTNLIADMIDDNVKPVPDEKYPPKIEGAEKTLRDTCMARAHEIYGDPLPEEIGSRLETELNAIINNGYAVMYVSAQMLVNKSLSDGYLVGSRGSVGSSFAATMAGITEVNPLDPHYICPKCRHLEWGDKQKYDCGVDMPEKKCPECGEMMRRDGFTIPFATFLGFEGNKEPDIDLNFAGEYQARAHRYVGEIFGEKNVYKAGTVGTIADRTAYGYVKKYFDETGKPVNKYEVERLATGCTGVKRTTGQHPGGIIIVPDDHEIYEFCPVQHPANDTKTDIVTTHFDYHKIDKNLLKLDILGHNVPSMIRQLQDMTGVDPLKVDLTDKKVLSIFNGTEALGIKMDGYKFTHGSYAIPEFGTSFVRQMLDDVKPSRFEDLIRMSGFSHGTNVWLNNAQDYIRQGVATMREAISTRDDIMNYCMLKGIDNERSFQIMENVRKKNRVLTEDDIREMKEHDIPEWYIDSCSKIEYMFPRAHAVAYVMMSFRLAWYKVYYPVEFYATYFTSVADDFNADVIMRGPDACLERIDEVRQKSVNATQKEKDEVLVLEVAYEMYARGFSFEHALLGESRATRFWEKDGKVLLPYSAYQGVGAAAATSLAEAYSEKPFDTIEDAVTRSGLNKAAKDVLYENGVFGDLPEKDQLSWSF